MKIFNLFIIVLLFTVIIIGCSEHQKLVKSNDYNKKYDKAIEYYNKGDFYRSQQLLEDMLLYFRGTEKAEKIHYYYAYCNYRTSNFILANFYFKNFTKTFPRSQYAQECLYMSAFCSFLESPESSLDQTSTYQAMKELQNFANTYPNSDSISKCNKLIDVLRFKLETKYFDQAMLYFKIQDYKASVISFKNLMKDFPTTSYKDQALLYIIKANYYYAKNSIDSKKADRYNDAIEAYKEFKAQVAQGSKYYKDADSFYKNSIKEYTKYKS
ncbi:MAG: hypothetical protein A2X12_12215 [Bacteroidetes bacterium GWE2_29_8]|nr:MAG: hypothetical protein A2X12_12215 [Bacteroidetes bacterium GWE2_29_8]OFY21329.1 MAG: hypothetical protein A2X02_05235 [Bacteroidetes bacterium GWF2_29_10]